MYTLMRLQFYKRIKFLPGFLLIMLIISFLFTSTLEKDGASAPNEGFLMINTLSILVLFALSIINTFKEQFNSKSRWLYLLPIKGPRRMIAKYLVLVFDVIAITFSNLLCGYLTQVVYFKSYAIGRTFLSETLKGIYEDGPYAIIGVLFVFSIIYCAIVVTQTLLYQNRALSMFVIGLITSITLFILMEISKLVALLVPTNQKVIGTKDITIFLEILSNGQLNIPNLAILLFTFILCTLITSKVTDRYLNF